MLETIIQSLTSFFLKMGLFGVIGVGYLESIFLPVPVDFVLWSYAFLHPEVALFYAFVAGVCSTLGAATSYFIGLKGGRPAFEFMFKNQHEQLEKIENLYNQYGILTVFVVASTPIPFMVFTLASGIFRMNFLAYIITCFIGRTFRFMLFTSLLLIFGDTIKQNIEIIFISIAVLFAIGFLLYKKYKKSH